MGFDLSELWEKINAVEIRAETIKASLAGLYCLSLGIKFYLVLQANPFEFHFDQYLMPDIYLRLGRD